MASSRSPPPSQRSHEFWAKLHGTTPSGIIAREGASGLAILKGNPAGFDQDAVWVFSNGLGQSWLPYGRGCIHRSDFWPSPCIPKPEEVAVIGLGSGDTVYSLGRQPAHAESDLH